MLQFLCCMNVFSSKGLKNSDIYRQNPGFSYHFPHQLTLIFKKVWFILSVPCLPCYAFVCICVRTHICMCVYTYTCVFIYMRVTQICWLQVRYNHAMPLMTCVCILQLFPHMGYFSLYDDFIVFHRIDTI